MKSQNNYIGDDKFQKMLEHYQCRMPLTMIKMRFIGAICSPNLELRPSDVISSLWVEGTEPRLETKEEANLFFKFFMGLWDDCFNKVQVNKISLPLHPNKTKEDLKLYCESRFAEVESGFVEGFWGGKDNLKLPNYLAELIDSMSDVADVYQMLIKKIDKDVHADDIRASLKSSDKMIEKAISFLIENSVLPRIDDLKREVIKMKKN